MDATDPTTPCGSKAPVALVSGQVELNSNVDAPPTLNVRLVCLESPIRGDVSPIPSDRAIKLEVTAWWATSIAVLNGTEPRTEDNMWPYNLETSEMSFKTFTKASGKYTMPTQGWDRLKLVGRPGPFGILYWIVYVCSKRPPEGGCVSYGDPSLLIVDHEPVETPGFPRDYSNVIPPAFPGDVVGFR